MQTYFQQCLDECMFFEVLFVLVGSMKKYLRKMHNGEANADFG